MTETTFTFPGTDITMPLVLTPADAHERRDELATALRALADAVQNGSFDFKTTTITLSLDYT